MKTIIIYGSKYGYTEDCVTSLAEKLDVYFVDKIITRLMKKAAAKEGKSEPAPLTDNIRMLAEIINSQ